MHRVKELEAAEVLSRATGNPQMRRIVILRRDDGHFSFAEEYFHTSECEAHVIARGWQQLPPNGVYDSAETAEAAGRAASAGWYVGT